MGMLLTSMNLEVVYRCQVRIPRSPHKWAKFGCFEGFSRKVVPVGAAGYRSF